MTDDIVYDTIPTLLTERMALCPKDDNDNNVATTTPANRHRLYVEHTALYQASIAPTYVLTIPSDIYYRTLYQEVYHARTVPCGMYFCGQQGGGEKNDDDDDHHHPSHDFFVHIQLAWTCVACAMGIMVYVAAFVPGNEDWSSS